MSFQESRDKWNVPGTSDYVRELPLDIVLNAEGDQRLRGYWLAYSERDGQICFVSNNNAADHLFVEVDPEGLYQIKWTSDTTEFKYDEASSTIRIERYS